MRSLLLVCALAGVAQAHISITSGPAIANKSQIITFGVGHGCTDANNKKLDTVKIKVIIPDGVTSVRAFRSDFGKPALTKTGTTVTAVEWTKPASELLDGDDGYYEIKIRAAVPNTPFAKVKFVVEQTCEDSTTHAQIVSNWDADDGATTGEPAPQLVVVPAHSTGWTRIMVPRALTKEELATYLGDAQIVWKGSAAYSSNANTAAMITATSGVAALDGVSANDELWVKY